MVFRTTNENMSNTNSEEYDDAHLYQSDGRFVPYTMEQKIVAAVWVHERKFNYQTLRQVRNNFRIRFQMPPPRRYTLTQWEKRLFTEGTLIAKDRSAKPLQRLMHVPYVKASLRDEPDLSLTKRASKLGLSKSILGMIMKYDLKDTDKNTQKRVKEGAGVANKKPDTVEDSKDDDSNH